MRWQDEERSDNVEDRRGMPVSRGMMGGGIGTVILVLVALYFGIDPSVILQSVPCLLYTSPSPRDLSTSRMPSSA